jgi:hypothetical protein
VKLLSSLDARDRRLLFWLAGIGLALAILTGFLLPSGNSNDNPMPSTYLAGRHGARAAYEALLRAGYPIERWERPLRELAATAGPETVVIFAEPYIQDAGAIKAVRQILDRGGRELSTGFVGGFNLPGEAVATPKTFDFAACKLAPEGLDRLSGSGEIWMTPEAGWAVGNPAHRVEYSCNGQPAVVEFDWAKGHAVWWAGSGPLENGSISRAGNLDLLLNSLGLAKGTGSIGTSRCMARCARYGASRPGLPLHCCGLVWRCWCCWWCSVSAGDRGRCAICRPRRVPRPSSFWMRWGRFTAVLEPLQQRWRLPGSGSGGIR